MSGIYGMNVSQISGTSSNPNIWQFFVAVIAFNVLVLLALALSAWIQIVRKHGRKAGLKEILGYSVGRIAAE
jgi:Mg2+ and Co2+ transporter CorA